MKMVTEMEMENGKIFLGFLMDYAEMMDYVEIYAEIYAEITWKLHGNYMEITWKLGGFTWKFSWNLRVIYM